MAEWTAQYINDLPDSAFAYIESGGEKDDTGRTTPRALRHFPHHNAEENLDLPHLRNALSRGPQSDVWPNGREHLEAHATAEGIGGRKSADGTWTFDEEIPAGAVKFVGPDTIEGPAFLFNADLSGERFTADTDLCIEWFGKSGRPLLYEHGLDDALKAGLVGRQVDYEARAEGIWAQAELKRGARFRKGIDALIERGVLSYSGGAMQHLAVKTIAGDIKRFPWVELSLTPTPANPANAGVYYLKSADAIAHLEEAHLAIPDPLKAALAALDEWATTRDHDDLPDGSSFADLVVRQLGDVAARVAARKAWHAKSGRALSTAARERLTSHPDQLRELADDLEALVTAEAGKTAPAVDLWEQQIEAEAAYARLLGVTLPVQENETHDAAG